MAGQTNGGQVVSPNGVNSMNQGRYVGNPNQAQSNNQITPPPNIAPPAPGVQFPPSVSAGNTMNPSFPGHPGHAAYLQNLKTTTAQPPNIAPPGFGVQLPTTTAQPPSVSAGNTMNPSFPGHPGHAAYLQNLKASGGVPPNIAPPAPGVQPPPTVAQPNINTLAAEGIKAAGAATAQGLSFNPQQVTANQLATTNMSPYTNPYDDAVVKATQDDMLRSNTINRNQLGASAGMANAYGGSRHGIAMSENDRNMTQQMAQATAGLRQAGFQNAQNQAQFDINNNLQGQMANQSAGLQGNQQRMGAANQMGSLANLGFNMGQTVNSNMAQQGAMQQALQQAIYDNAQNKFGQFTGQPVNSLGYLNNALGVTPDVGSSTLTSKKGLFDYLTLGAQIMGA